MNNSTENKVTASVVFEQGVAKPCENPDRRHLAIAAKAGKSCYVRDILAHQTLEVVYVDGKWIKSSAVTQKLEPVLA